LLLLVVVQRRAPAQQVQAASAAAPCCCQHCPALHHSGVVCTLIMLLAVALWLAWRHVLVVMVLLLLRLAHDPGFAPAIQKQGTIDDGRLHDPPATVNTCRHSCAAGVLQDILVLGSCQSRCWCVARAARGFI
jgi:hypothetical protein